MRILSTLIISFFIVSLSFHTRAQISQGGKPFSFGKFFKQQSIIPIATMPVVNLDSLRNEDEINDKIETKPFRFGYNYYSNLSLYNSGLWTKLENGDRIWQLAIRCPDALTINLALNNFYLPKGAKLFIYNSEKSYWIGAFTNENNNVEKEMGTDLIPGQEIILEYFEPASVSGLGSINVWRITHGYRSIAPVLEQSIRAFGGAGACQINVKCPLGIGWEDQIKSVACIVAGGSEICTGALVNNTANDGTPYFLTANHCTGGGGVTSWVFRFNWESAACPNPGSSPASNSISGCVIRSQSTISDFALLELSAIPPAGYNVYYSGWSRLTTPATSVMGIHHPSGDIKKISEAANPVAATTWGSPTAQVWEIGMWTQGNTEPGSSGSPLFDQNRRVIGQLFGGPSFCGATGTSLKDFYGRFDVSWTGGGTPATRLSDWLDPSGTSPFVLDGFDPNAIPPAFADDAGASSITTPISGYSSCNTSITPDFILKNYGSNTLVSATVNYQLDGGAVQTQSWSGSLSSLNSELIALPTFTSLTVGAHTLLIYTTNPNGISDLNTSNDTNTVNFSITNPSPIGTAPVINDFEISFPGSGFTVENPDAADTWISETTLGGFGLSAKCMSIDNFTNNFTGQSDYLHTAYLDLTTITGTAGLAFDVAYAPYDTAYFDSLKVWVSSNCTSPTLVYSKGNTTLATAPATTTIFSPISTQWRTDIIDMTAFAGQSNVRVSFENKSGYGQKMYIDNINLSASLGLNEKLNENSFKIVPNPAGTSVVISGFQNESGMMIALTNALGENVQSQKILSTVNSITLDLSSLSSGLYFVTVNNGKTSTVKKLIKE